MKRYRRSPQVVTRCIGDELVLVPVGPGIIDLQCLFSANPSGRFVWEQLEQPRTFKELVGALQAEFEVEHEQAERDLERFLAELLCEGCLQEEDA